MKLLISNDDGVYAPGIKSLYKTLAEEHSTFVVAPLEERSTTGHTLSLDNPLRVVEVDGENNIYGCSGYPADCTLMGFGKLMKERPDLIVSGINRGANLGQDIYYSGTAAAAREGVFHGIPAIAVSSVCDFSKGPEHPIYFDTAARFILELLRKNILELIAPFHLVNINVPDAKWSDIAGVKITELGFRNYSEEITERKDFRGRSYYWVGGVYKGFEGNENTDCFSVDKNYISVSVLNLLGGASEKISKWQELMKEFTF